MNQKLKAISRYTIFNGLFAAAAYYGVYVGVPWVANFLIFALWVFFALGIFSFGAMFLVKVLILKGEMEIEKQRDYSKTINAKFFIPMWIDWTYDFLFTSFLVYSGWLGYAAVYLIGCCILSNLAKLMIKECTKICDEQVEEYEREEASRIQRRERWSEEANEDTVQHWEGETEDDDLFRMGVLTETPYDPPPTRED